MLTLTNVEKVYLTEKEAIHAITNLQLHVKKGEFISFIGPSGCGKTTVLSMIAGLLSPTSGEIILNGTPIKGPTGKTGYMLQQDYLFPWLTIRKNIELGLTITKKKNEKNMNRALNLLAQLGLGDKIDSLPNELSGGMRQRAALVRMLAPNPSLLLLDEPFSALDYQTKLQLEDLVFSTLKKREKTAILVTHDISEAIAMSDRICLFDMNPGTIKKIFKVPKKLRNKLPFDARYDPDFQPIFQKVWKELKNVENKNHQTS